MKTPRPAGYLFAMNTPAFLILAALATACRSPEDKPDSGDTDTSPPDDTDTGDTDTGEPIPWGTGERSISGRAYFFDMETLGKLEWTTDVKGAEVYVLDAPELRVALSPATEHAFTISGIPDNVEVTLALVHPDYFPHLSAVLPVADQDIVDVNFQAVSHYIADLIGMLVDQDPQDKDHCQMTTTISAPNADSIWAVGEPDAIAIVDPTVPAEQGPFYFNEQVIPQQNLTASTADGGVIVAGAEPGIYTWNGQKEGFTFDTLKMRCVAGWLTNAVPPLGMNAHPL